MDAAIFLFLSRSYLSALRQYFILNDSRSYRTFKESKFPITGMVSKKSHFFFTNGLIPFASPPNTKIYDN